VHRGQCSFTIKANIAEEAGASAILIINYRTGVCMQFLLFWSYSLFHFLFLHMHFTVKSDLIPCFIENAN